jgi:DNA-binding CsgD family transcriptional regulator
MAASRILVRHDKKAVADDAGERTGSRTRTSVLTDRERQVVAILAEGRTTKEIAHALGISDSTTRVLLARAALRLSVRSRQELVQAVAAEALPDQAVAAEALPDVEGLASAPPPPAQVPRAG